MNEDSYVVDFLPKARADLSRIEEYYLKEASCQVAAKAMRSIYNGIFILKNRPKAGWAYDSEARRIWYVYDGRYVVLYLLHEEIRLVEIFAVVSARTNWRKYLDEYFRRRRSKFSSPR